MANTYPSGPVTMVVPFPVGGSVDTGCRALATILSKNTGQNFLIDNKPGATGAIGTSSVAKAKPDGYTLVCGNSDPLAANVVKFPELAYDPQTQLTPVSTIYRNTLAIFASADAPYKTVPELVEYVKTHPGEMSYGTSGAGSVLNILGEMTNRDAGTDMLHIPYGGGGAALNDLLGGNLPLVYGSAASALPHVKQGTIQVLAIFSEEPLDSLPDVPVMKDFYPALVREGWGMVETPAGTPGEIIAYLNTEIRKALESDELKQVYGSSGLIPSPSSPEDSAHLVQDEIRFWTEAKDLVDLSQD